MPDADRTSASTAAAATAAAAAPNAVLEPVFAALRRHDALPAMGQTLARLTQMLESDTEAVQDLANVILADVSLTQRLLQVANTIPFRVSGGPVTTITRAIMLLGFEQIRAAAVSLVLLDGLARGEHGQRVREDFHQALLASSLARELLLEDGALEAEEAGIAAMFRGVGRLLVAIFAPEAIAAVRASVRAERIGEGVAARRVLGMGFDEVTTHALRAWNLPDKVMAFVQTLPPRIGTPTGALDRIRAGAQLADEVTSTLFLAQGTEREQTLADLMARFQPAVALDRQRLVEALAHAGARTRELEQACGLPAAARSAEALLEPIDDEVRITPVPVTTAQQRDAVGRPANAREILVAGLAEATDCLARAPAGGDLNGLIRIAIEAMFTALGYARTAFVMRDASGQYRTRAGFGTPAARFAFPAHGPAHLFTAALAQGTDLHIADAGAAKVQARLPDWFKEEFAATRSFLLMPLQLGGKPLGFFYADRLVTDAAGLAAEELNLLRTLRNQVLLALRSR